MDILAAARGNLRLVWGTGKSGTFKTAHTGRVELSYFEGQKVREREITAKTEAVAKLFGVCGRVEFERGVSFRPIVTGSVKTLNPLSTSQ